MKPYQLLALSGLFSFALLAPATAASVTITAIEFSGNVVFSFNGSVNLTGATSAGGPEWAAGMGE